MRGSAGALGFLIVRSTRNRLAQQLARVRNPRYAIAAVVGVLYVLLVFVQPGSTPPPRPASSNLVVGQLAGLGLGFTMILWWLGRGSSVRAALAFQPAEVQLLFSAPLSRRQLLGYKIARGQLLLLVSCLFWAFLIRRWGVSQSPLFRYWTAWGVFSVLSLHRMAAALVMVEPVRGARRVALWLGRTLAAGAVIAVMVGIGRVLPQLGQLLSPEAIKALGAALRAPPAGYALAPFRLIVAPLYAVFYWKGLKPTVAWSS